MGRATTNIKQANPIITEELLEGHLAVLREKVFNATRNLPQFNLLLDEIVRLSKSCTSKTTVVAFERTLLYGKNFLAPFFSKSRFVSLDCSPPSADSRGAYNCALVEDPRFIDTECKSVRCEPDDLKIDDEFADLVLIPNLVHHVVNQEGMFAEAFRVTKLGGRLFIFEPTLRELHQEPDDYLRYTLYGISYALQKVGFRIVETETTGGPFTAIAYCWLQALQYIPTDERAQWSEWFDKHLSDLEDLEARYKKNLVRKFTSFPTAFAITCQKPFLD